jgi:hypothetical protein
MHPYWPPMIVAFAVILLEVNAWYGSEAAWVAAGVAVLAFKGGELMAEHRANSPPGAPDGASIRPRPESRPPAA